jgi:Ca2+/H+ antiporter
VDLYLGEEAANRYVVDISRIQKLVVTILLVVAYGSWLWKTFGTVSNFFARVFDAGCR